MSSKVNIFEAREDGRNEQEFERFVHYLQSHADELTNFVEPPAEGTTDALVPLTRAAALRRRSVSRS